MERYAAAAAAADALLMRSAESQVAQLSCLGLSVGAPQIENDIPPFEERYHAKCEPTGSSPKLRARERDRTPFARQATSVREAEHHHQV